MPTGIALCRHPLSQFSYANLPSSIDIHLLCHETKSQVREAGPVLPPERVRVYENYDVNPLVEFDAAGLVEAGDCAGIIALSEIDVLRAADLRTRYGLPGVQLDTAWVFRDKVAMKERLRAAGLRVPRFRAVGNGLDVRDALRDYGYPFVLKPRLGGGSVGAQVLRSDTELHEALSAGLQPNFYTPAHLEAEEFVAGDLYHVDGLVLAGEVALSSVSRYRSDLLQFTTPLSSRMVRQDSPIAKTMTAFAVRVLTELGLRDPEVDTYFHCEIFDAPQGPTLCEIAARPGGLGVVDQLDAYCGSSTFDLLLRATFGAEPPDGGVVVPGADLFGWIGVPVARPMQAARLVVPGDHLAGVRQYDRSNRPAHQISSVDLNGVLVVRGRSEAELESVMTDAVERLSRSGS